MLSPVSHIIKGAGNAALRNGNKALHRAMPGPSEKTTAVACRSIHNLSNPRLEYCESITGKTAKQLYANQTTMKGDTSVLERMMSTKEMLYTGAKVEAAMANASPDFAPAVFSTSQPTVLGVVGYSEAILQQLNHKDPEIREQMVKQLLESDNPGNIVASQQVIPFRHREGCPERACVTKALRNQHFDNSAAKPDMHPVLRSILLSATPGLFSNMVKQECVLSFCYGNAGLGQIGWIVDDWVDKMIKAHDAVIPPEMAMDFKEKLKKALSIASLMKTANIYQIYMHEDNAAIHSYAAGAYGRTRNGKDEIALGESKGVKALLRGEVTEKSYCSLHGGDQVRVLQSRSFNDTEKGKQHGTQMVNITDPDAVSAYMERVKADPNADTSALHLVRDLLETDGTDEPSEELKLLYAQRKEVNSIIGNIMKEIAERINQKDNPKPINVTQAHRNVIEV